jgi:HK97 family phage major capsid protein
MLSTATASNDNVLVIADFSYFVIVDRIGMQITHSDWVLGTNRRPTGQHGFLALWRTGSDLVNTDAGRLLVV